MGKLTRSEKFRRGAGIVAAALIFCVSGLLLFLPFPKKTHGSGERYLLAWEDGTVTAESYSSALSFLEEGEETALRFVREGKHASLSAGEGYCRAYALLREGPLPLLLNEPFELSALERTALYKKFGDVGYFSYTLFRFDGEKFCTADGRVFREAVLLDGTVTGEALSLAGAEKLTVCKGAELTAASLKGSKIREIALAEPYYFKDGGIYLETPGGVRLVAAMPFAESLSLRGYDYADEGALSPAIALKTLTLPYLGSQKAPYGSDRHTTLQWLFGEVPESLVSLRVTGGRVEPFAFSGCGNLQEINLCGIAERYVSPSAFAACTSLKKLHTSLKNLSLDGEFTQEELPCGCTLYSRRESK